jgi:hypothetical protein
MSSLPPDIDFLTNRKATPERMNLAMAYLYGRLNQASALQPEFQSAIDELQATGLQRLNDTLTPLVLRAQADAAQLDQILAAWTTGSVLVALKAAIEADLASGLAGVNTTLATDVLAIYAAISKAVPDSPGAGRMLLSTSDPKGSAWAALPWATKADLLAGTRTDVFFSPSILFAASASVAVSYAATVTLDFAQGLNFHLSALTGPCLFANPLNMKSGQSGSIKIPQDTTGSRVGTWGSFWKFSAGAPVLTTTPSAYDVVYWLVRDTSTIECSINKALA